MTVYEYFVTNEDENERLDKLLSSQNKNYSRSQIQTWIKHGQVKVNDDLVVKPNYRCQTRDQIIWSIPKEKKINLIPENIPLSVVYEDDYLLVVNKQAGMVIHPTNAHQNGTLVHALLYHVDHLSIKGGVHRPGIVHRLDKDTGGLLVVAKNDDIHTELTNQFKNNEVERKYQALVHGIIDHQSGLIDAPIGRDPSNRLRMAVVDHGKQARTHFRVLHTYDTFTLIECELETGRTHQIRVHMNYINHPLVRDPVYNREQTTDSTGQALYARSLGFIHPEKNQWIRFEVEQPDYFSRILMEIYGAK